MDHNTNMLNVGLDELRQQLNERIQTSGVPQLPDNFEPYRDDIGKELRHAFDVEQWIRKLDPNPSIELILAGQNHDFERILFPGSTGGFTGDRKSPEYLDYKKDHATRSSIAAIDRLMNQGYSAAVVSRTALLILHHDDTGDEIRAIGDLELQTLVSADSLSFFTCIAPDMMSRNVSKDQIQAKMRFMIGKMDEKAIRILSQWNSPDGVLEAWKTEVLQEFI